jgi:hypothetical protein
MRARTPRDERTVPRASWYRYLQAASVLHDEGKPATETAIARELRISRMSLWRLHRRNPGLKMWAHEQFMKGNAHLVGPVIRMLGTAALRTKSPKHAELFLRAVGSLDPMNHVEGGDRTRVNVNTPVVINNLVPRPEWPKLPPTAPPPSHMAEPMPTLEIPCLQVGGNR